MTRGSHVRLTVALQLLWVLLLRGYRFREGRETQARTVCVTHLAENSPYATHVADRALG